MRIASVLCLALIAGVSSTAHAAPGDLDPSFGRYGKVPFPPGVGVGAFDDVEVQSGGRILAFSKVLLAVLPDGRVDRGFGAGGVLSPQVNSSERGSSTVTLEEGEVAADDSIFTAGMLDSSWVYGRPYVTKLRPDGTVDDEFGDEGSVILPPTQTAGTDVKLALGGTGEIAVASQSSEGISIAKVTAAGELDPDFSQDGIATIPAPAGTWAGLGSAPTAIAVGREGAVTAAFRFERQAWVVRLTRTGERDQSFGTGGVTAVGDFTGRSWVNGLALDRAERVVIVGDAPPPYGRTRAFIARLGSDGRPDQGFSQDGLATPFGREGMSSFGDVLIDEAQRPIAVGSVGGDFLVTRFTGRGKRDQSFGSGGATVTGAGGNIDAAQAAALQDDGRIVVAGRRGFSGFRTNRYESALARLLVGGRRHDADADGFRDRRDRCVGVAAPGRRGCPFYERSVTLEAERVISEDEFRLTGEIRARARPCRRTPVRLVRVKPGQDEPLGLRSAVGYERTGFPIPERPGNFYVRAPKRVVSEAGVCGEAKSPPLRIKRGWYSRSR